MNHGKSIILKSYLCLHISVLLKIVFRSPLLETPTFLSLTSTSKCWVIGLPATPLAERLQHLPHQWRRRLMPTLHAWMGTWEQMSEAWKSRFQLACPPKDIIVFMQVRRHWLSATQQSRGRQTRGKNHHPGHREAWGGMWAWVRAGKMGCGWPHRARLQVGGGQMEGTARGEDRQPGDSLWRVLGCGSWNLSSGSRGIFKWNILESNNRVE